MTAGRSRPPIELIADAGPEAGWGHLSRSSGLAVALGSRQLSVRCRGFGIDEPIERDGVEWTPLTTNELDTIPDRATVWLDSYLLRIAEVEDLAGRARLCTMYDGGEGPPRNAALVVSVGEVPQDPNEPWLSGTDYACLRPSFWGAGRRELNDEVGSILVTTGAGATGAAELAAAIRQFTSVKRILLVRGPLANPGAEPEGVEVLQAPDSLFDALAQADLAVTAGGQTMLEAASLGTPCIALATSGDQRGQVDLLANGDAVLPVAPSTVTAARDAVLEMITDAGRRRALSKASQQAVDGFGALRVAFAIDVLARAL